MRTTRLTYLSDKTLSSLYKIGRVNLWRKAHTEFRPLTRLTRNGTRRTNWYYCTRTLITTSNMSACNVSTPSSSASSPNLPSCEREGHIAGSADNGVIERKCDSLLEVNSALPNTESVGREAKLARIDGHYQEALGPESVRTCCRYVGRIAPTPSGHLHGKAKNGPPNFEDRHVFI
jgi:hypothetical protein